ncbi:unnamed protein product, partial [Durusdinium trenchii]
AAVKGLEARAYPVAYPGLRFFYCGSSVNAYKMLAFETVFKHLQTYGLRWLCLLLWEAQESVASIAAAYSLGKQESQAAICLLHKMQWTQPKFISHESISGGYLNDKFCSATGVFAPWKAELTNSEELTQVLLTLNERAENEQRSPPANALCDTEKLCAWAKNYDLYTSQQGALDYKHINDRYIRGKKTVDDWMNKKYQTQNHPHCRYMRCWCWDSLVQIKGIVQQRGVAATTTIILELLEGMDLSPETPLLIVDLVPSRFNEWGLAAWDLQRRTLTQEDKFDRQPDVRFLGLYHNDQAAEMGAACSYHKTQSEKLNARIPDLVKDKFQSQADVVKSLMDEIEEKRDMALAVKQWSSGDGPVQSSCIPWLVTCDKTLVAMIGD